MPPLALWEDKPLLEQPILAFGKLGCSFRQPVLGKFIMYLLLCFFCYIVLRLG